MFSDVGAILFAIVIVVAVSSLAAAILVPLDKAKPIKHKKVPAKNNNWYFPSPRVSTFEERHADPTKGV